MLILRANCLEIDFIKYKNHAPTLACKNVTPRHLCNGIPISIKI